MSNLPMSDPASGGGRTPDQPANAAGDLRSHAVSPIAAYSDLSPDQTHAAARAFIERFRALDDPRAREYAQLNPDAVLPSQLHEMHRCFAAERYPDALNDILQHPDVSGTTDGFATGERDRRARPPRRAAATSRRRLSARAAHARRD